jgi:hypothetical protein
MSKRVVGEKGGDAVLRMLVARQVFVEARARRHAGLFQLHHHERQPVDEADEIGTAGAERARDAELADEQEVVFGGGSPIDDAHTLGLLPAARPVGQRDANAFLEEQIHLAIGLCDQHGRTIAHQFIDSGGDGFRR